MITLYRMYPTLLNLYGAAGELHLLSLLLEQAGETVETVAVQPGDAPDFSAPGLLLFAAGTERKVARAAQLGQAILPQLKKARADGCLLLFLGASALLPLPQFTNLAGESCPGFSLVQGEGAVLPGRDYREVWGRRPGEDALIFGPKNSSLRLQADAPPFVELQGEAGGREGYAADGLIATELAAPLLVRNPPLLRQLAAQLVGRELPAPQGRLFAECEAGYAALRRKLLNLQPADT